jgi:hypothetical protein
MHILFKFVGSNRILQDIAKRPIVTFLGKCLTMPARETIIPSSEFGALNVCVSVDDSYCSSCRGNGRSGGPKAGSVVDKAYLSLITDQGLRTIVITGRPDFNTPDWRNNVPGHPMTDQEITDVVAWLASQRPNRTAASSLAATSPGGAA